MASDDRTVIKPVPGGGRRPPPGTGGSEGVSEGPAVPSEDRNGLGQGLNPLERAASVLLRLITRLKGTPSHPDPASLRQQAIEAIQAFEARAQARGIDRETVRAARYVLCTALDEVVLETPWGSHSVWNTQSLLTTFHGDARGGERFFALLERIKQSPARNLHLLELMYLCLALGFEGKYRLESGGRERLRDWQEALYRLIRTQRGGFERALSPHWEGVSERRNPLMQYAPLWVVGSVAGVLLLGVYVTLSFTLNRQSDPVFNQLHALAQEAVPQVARAESPPPSATPQHPRLAALLAPDIEAGRLAVRQNGGSETIVLRVSGFFDSGSAWVDSQFQPLLQRIAEALSQVPGPVLVTGHTDNVPIRSLRYPSNWHLSQARAEAVVQRLAAATGTPERFRAEGQGSAEPLVPNNSAANRAMNRRVEITIQGPGEASRAGAASGSPGG